MIRSILCFICLFVGTHAFAQSAKIKSLYEKGEYDKCLKICEKQQFKDPMVLEAWLYDALIWTHYAEEAENQLHAFKKARESLKVLRQKDLSAEFLHINWDLYLQVIQPQLELVDKIAQKKEFETAYTLCLDLIDDLNDQRLYFFIGCSWVQNEEIEIGLEFLDKGLKYYFMNYQKYKIQPEPYFVDQILITAKDLISYKLYRVGWGCFKFLEEVYPNNPPVEIEAAYIETILQAMRELKPDHPDLQLVLDTYLNAKKNYPKKNSLKGLTKNYLNNLLDNSSLDYVRDDSWEILAKGIKPLLELKQSDEANKNYIQERISSKIYELFEKRNEVALKLYDFSKELLKSVETEDKIAENYFYTGYTKKEPIEQAKAFLMYGKKEGDYRQIFAKEWKSFQENLSKNLEKQNTEDSVLDEIHFYLEHFPNANQIRAAISKYIIREVKKLKTKKAYSKAYLLLYWGKYYFKDKTKFIELELDVAKADYQKHYLGSYFDNKELAWTGSVENCDPGQISYQAQLKALERYNYIRRLAGIPDGNILDTTANQYGQAAALCMKAQGNLSHHPKPDWKCYSEDAHKGARSNSLGLGSCCSNSLDGMIEDEGENNKETGHRRNLLNFRAKGFRYAATNNTVAMSSAGPSHDKLSCSNYRRSYIAWPPEGAVPKELVFRRFSFRKMMGSYSIERVTSIKVYYENKELETNIEHKTASKIGWVVRDLPNFKERGESTIKVVLDLRIRESKAPKTVQKIIEYEIRVF